jgi:ABC-type multidrug transport system fused ATPase/permease subunit
LSAAPDESSAGLGQIALADAFPRASALRSRDVFRLIPRIWPFVRPYRRDLLYLFLMLAPGLPIGLLLVVMTQVLVDVVAQGEPLGSIQARLLLLEPGATRHEVLVRWLWASAALGLPMIAILMAVLRYAILILQRISNLFRVNLYDRLQELSLKFHAEEKIGDAIFRMFQDSAAIPEVINGLVIQPLRWLPLAIADLVWLATFNYAIAIVAVTIIPADLVLAWLFGRSLRRGFIGEREAAAQATTRIEETLASIKAVKAFGAEDREGARYAADNWNAFLAARRARMRLVTYRVLANTLRGTGYVAALYLGASQAMAGGTSGFAAAAVSLGLFQGAIILFSRVTRRTQGLIDLWGSLQDVTVAISRVLEMLAIPADERVASGRRLPPRTVKRLAFEEVTFGYDPRRPVIAGVNLDAHAGELTAIAGPSGSGKSTVIALILRFFEPAAGRITLDGAPIGEFELEAYRGLLSVALQESPLFSASIRANVAYSRPEASAAEIAAAVARAGLADWVRSLPAGLDTALGEKGAKLSSGQAQRIGLARALLRDAPILLLDEPTSALDAATEEFVMRGIRDWVREDPVHRMAIIATHRRTTAALCDRIYQITAGRLAASDQSAFDLPARAEARDA